MRGLIFTGNATSLATIDVGANSHGNRRKFTNIANWTLSCFCAIFISPNALCARRASLSLQVLTLSGLDYKDRRTSLQPKQHRNIQLTGHYIPCRLLTTATWSFVRCCCSLGIEPRERHSSAYRAAKDLIQVQAWTCGTEHGTRSSRVRSAIRVTPSFVRYADPNRRR